MTVAQELLPCCLLYITHELRMTFIILSGFLQPKEDVEMYEVQVSVSVKRIFWHRVMLIGLRITSGCSCIATAELNR